MLDLDKWQEILSTMGKNPLRTILTSVSVAVGIFMLVVLLGLGQGLQNGVNSTLGDDAVNSIWIRSGRTSLPYMGYKSNRRVQYHNDDHDYVVENMDGVATSSSRLAFWGTAIKWKNKSSDYNIRCVHPGHQEVEKTLVATGRYISEKDVADARKVAVIGQAIVDEFFEGHNPLGEYMEVKGIQFRIVGTFNDPNSRWENRQIYLPITTGQKLFGSGNDAINMFIVSTGTSSFDRSEQLTEEIDGYLHAKHKVAPADQRGITVRNLNEEAKKINDIFMGIDIFLIGMGFFT
ncbi:MAG: ABC transporter permease, partial [Bacteroidota bacterium]